MTRDSKEMALTVADILDDKKALDIVVLDIRHLSALADYFVIASGRSETQVKTMYDELMKKMNERGVETRHRDGFQQGRWIALDYGDVIVHLFHHEERNFYKLERLWADGQRLAVNHSEEAHM